LFQEEKEEEKVEDKDQEEEEAVYQNISVSRRQSSRLSAISKVETVVSVNRCKEEELEEELSAMSITSADYGRLTEEVERLQRQLSGMDDSRKVYEAATKQLVSFLELVSSQLSIDSVIDSKPKPRPRVGEKARQGEFERKNRARMAGSRISDVGLGSMGTEDLVLTMDSKRRVTLDTSSTSSSFRRQRGLRRRPVSAQDSPLPSLGKGSVSSDGSSELDSGKDSGRFTDSERGSPTGGEEKGRSSGEQGRSSGEQGRRKELGERGAALVKQVKRFLGGGGDGGEDSSAPSTPLRPMSGRASFTSPFAGLRPPLTSSPLTPMTPLTSPLSQRVKVTSPLGEGSPLTSTPVASSTTPSRNRVVIQLGPSSQPRVGSSPSQPMVDGLPGWKGPRVRGATSSTSSPRLSTSSVNRTSSTSSTPHQRREVQGRRGGCSIETDSLGTVSVPVPFIQPPQPWL